MTEKDIENIYWELISQDRYDDRIVFIYKSVDFRYNVKKHFEVMLNCNGEVTDKNVHYEYGSRIYHTKGDLLTALNGKRLGIESVIWELSYSTPQYHVYSSTNVGGLVKGISRKDGSVTYGYRGKRVKTEKNLLDIINKNKL